MLQNLERLDQELFLWLNSKHNAFFDVIMYWASSQFFWIPFYLALAVYLFRKLGKTVYYYYLCIALLITASDQLSSHLIKNWARRPRPSHVPEISNMIHLSKAGPGGLYGFVSSHASNSFALAIFLVLTLPPAFNWLKHGMVGWALLVAYSRIYNGVHYPGDVLGGMLLGALLAFLFSRLFRYFIGAYLLAIRKISDRRHPVE